VTRRRTMIRFRCGHCRARPAMHRRHLRGLVTCHACGRTTHPAVKAGQFLSGKPAGGPPACVNCGQTIGKLQVVCQWLGQTVCHPCHTRLSFEAATNPSKGALVGASPKSQLAAARSLEWRLPPATAATASPLSMPAGLELSAAPLVPLMLVGMTGAAFFVAVSLMSYVGGFVSALALVAAAAVGLRWLKRGTLSIRARLDQIELLRLRHGTLRLMTMLVAWLWSQPARRKPAACMLVLMWGVIYAPYFLSAIILFTPRPRPLHVRV
jgi:hypothetical protein